MFQPFFLFPVHFLIVTLEDFSASTTPAKGPRVPPVWYFDFSVGFLWNAFILVIYKFDYFYN